MPRNFASPESEEFRDFLLDPFQVLFAPEVENPLAFRNIAYVAAATERVQVTITRPIILPSLNTRLHVRKRSLPPAELLRLLSILLEKTSYSVVNELLSEIHSRRNPTLTRFRLLELSKGAIYSYESRALITSVMINNITSISPDET